VQKERMTPDQMFTLAIDGTIISRPADSTLRPSDCTSLFMGAIRLRNAGAVIHSHSIHAVIATLLFDREFDISDLEMIKGIEGMGYHDRLVVPIIENTSRESDLASSLETAILAMERRTYSCLRTKGGVPTPLRTQSLLRERLL